MDVTGRITRLEANRAQLKCQLTDAEMAEEERIAVWAQITELSKEVNAWWKFARAPHALPSAMKQEHVCTAVRRDGGRRKIVRSFAVFVVILGLVLVWTAHVQVLSTFGRRLTASTSSTQCYRHSNELANGTGFRLTSECSGRENRSLSDLNDWNRCLHPGLPLPAEGIILPLFGGGRLACYPRNDIVCSTLLDLGRWEPFTVDVLQSVLDVRWKIRSDKFVQAGMDQQLAQRIARNDVVFVDVGGNVGAVLYPIALAGFHTITFEPYPVNAQLLHVSRCLNGLTSRDVEIVNIGLADRQRHCAALRHSANMGNIIVRCNEEEINESFREGHVFDSNIPILTFDDVMRLRSLASEALPLLPQLNRSSRLAWKEFVLKLDIEGHELNMVLGAREFFGNPFTRPDVMMVEVWSNKGGHRWFVDERTPHQTLCHTLIEYGYVAYANGLWLKTHDDVDAAFAGWTSTGYVDTIFIHSLDRDSDAMLHAMGLSPPSTAPQQVSAKEAQRHKERNIEDELREVQETISTARGAHKARLRRRITELLNERRKQRKPQKKNE